MKQFLVTGVLMLFLVAFSACKKDHTCSCTYTDGAGDTQTATTVIPDASKKDAKEGCETLEATLKVGFSDASCSL